MQPYELLLCAASARRPRYGEGSALLLVSGDVFLAYSEFYTENQDDYGAAHVVARTSTDRGRTWNEPWVLVENDALTVFSVSLVRLPTGRILLGYCRKAPTSGGSAQLQVNCIPWFRASDDEGASWSEPWPMDIAGPHDYWVLANDRLVVHSSGRLLAPIGPMKPRGQEDPYYSTAICAYSDDQGQTWQPSETELELDAIFGLEEPCVVELTDGSLMMFMRTSRGHQYQSVSHDRGHTWSAVGSVAELISPVSPVNVKRIPATGDLLAIFNKTYDPIGRPGLKGFGMRTPLTASVSLDDGKSWSLLRNIENDPQLVFDYPSITFLGGEQVLVCYHQTQYFSSLTDWRRNFKLKILPVQWFYESSGSGKTTIPLATDSELPRGAASLSDAVGTSDSAGGILYVSDPSSIATTLLPDPVRVEDLTRWIDLVADSGVDIFDQEVFSQGWTCYWRSERYEYDRRHQHCRFLPLLDSGTQPLQILVERCQARGMRFVAGFRVNDDHAFQARQQGVGIAEFIEAHPEWCLTEFPEGEGYRMSEPLDFTYQEVRDFTYGVIEEVLERFDVDGIEMCFRDQAYFPYRTGVERGALMTQLMRRIRALVNDKARRRARGGSRQRGRNLIFGARVFATLQECTEQGLQVSAWLDERLLDYLSPQDPMYADFNGPYAAFAELAHASGCKLYPGMLPYSSLRLRQRMGEFAFSPANLRALARTLYGAGADGLSVYNQHSGAWIAPFLAQRMLFYRVLRDPKRVAAGERHYIFDPTWAGQEGFGQVGRYANARKLVLERPPQTGASSGEYRFKLYEDLERAEGATLAFRGFGLTENDELVVRLNGNVIPSETIGRTRESDVPATDWHHVRWDNERQVKCIPEQSRVDFRPPPAPAFSTRWFALAPTTVVWGENCLSLSLLESDPDAGGQIVIDELEIWVQPA